MAYEQLEEIRGRKGEKIVLFLTVENLVGVVCLALPVYLATTSAPFLVRLVLLALAGVLGYVATVEIGGLALYARVSWLVRGWLRRRADQFSGGGGTTPRADRALRVGGAIAVATRSRGQQAAATARRAGTKREG